MVAILRAPISPRTYLSALFLATRLPFLTATLVPVFLGIAAAGLDHRFTWWSTTMTRQINRRWLQAKRS